MDDRLQKLNDLLTKITTLAGIIVTVVGVLRDKPKPTTVTVKA